jgi:hypothetical protein
MFEFDGSILCFRFLASLFILEYTKKSSHKSMTVPVKGIVTTQYIQNWGRTIGWVPTAEKLKNGMANIVCTYSKFSAALYTRNGFCAIPQQMSQAGKP